MVWRLNIYISQRSPHQLPLPQMVDRDSYSHESVTVVCYLMNQCFSSFLYEIKLVMTSSPLTTEKKRRSLGQVPLRFRTADKLLNLFCIIKKRFSNTKI